jgi:hypothetical protein
LTRDGVSQLQPSDGVRTLRRWKKAAMGSCAEPGTMFSFCKSSYVDDTALILLSRGELVAVYKLIVSHFSTFLFTPEVKEKAKTRKRRPFTYQAAADTDCTEIDEDRFMPSASSSST